MKRELKVGMRVAVYGKTGNFLPIRKTGTIEAIVNGLIRFDSSVDPELRGKFDPHTGGWDLTLVHPKQAVPIRIVKKQRREWILQGDPVACVSSYVHRPILGPELAMGEQVRVREVKERK